MLNKGANVTTGKFGNEGSGGQSYKVYPWEVGKRYGFLLRGQPAINNSTDYTAYFMDPDNGHWDLIASFRRPKGQSHLTRLYSFLESFIPNTGVLERQGGYYNQWVMDTHGNWISLDKAVFTADQTAKVKDRMDYSGGVENGGFYLKNCGFSDLRTKVETQLSRPSNHEPPIIDFHDLNTQF